MSVKNHRGLWLDKDELSEPPKGEPMLGVALTLTIMLSAAFTLALILPWQYMPGEKVDLSGFYDIQRQYIGFTYSLESAANFNMTFLEWSVRWVKGR